MSVDYLLRYTVVAASRLDAIAKATAMLRTGLRLNGVTSAEPSAAHVRPVSATSRETADPNATAFWRVVLHVNEDA